MATEIEVETIEDVSLILLALLSKTKELREGVERNRLLRSLESYNEGLRKYIRSLTEPPQVHTRHVQPMCIIHGKPITWEDIQCEDCKKELGING